MLHTGLKQLFGFSRKKEQKATLNLRGLVKYW